jgi:hypothetical protein
MVLVAAPAAAQTTREALIVAEQAEKAAHLRPYEPTRAEAIVRRIGGALTGPPRGLYPWIGSIFPGGFLAAGPGYRRPISGAGAFDAQAAVSVKTYALLRATLALPPMWDRRVHLSLQSQFIDAPRVRFHGLGQQSLEEDATTFGYRPVRAGAWVGVAPVRVVTLGSGVDYLAIDTSRGRGRRPAADRFTPVEAPGLLASPRYTVSRAFAAFDWRDAPGYSRRGGLYRVEWSRYDQRDADRFSFRRLDAELQQLIPVLRGNWVFAVRALASTTDTDAGQQVPFFLMPQIGGGSDLRGYSSWRFRDRHKVLVGVEYRWTPSHFLDMAIFHDAGKVVSSRAAINLRGLSHTNGIGLRFHAPSATLLRIELARGAEGVRLIVAFSPIS